MLVLFLPFHFEVERAGRTGVTGWACCPEAASLLPGRSSVLPPGCLLSSIWTLSEGHLACQLLKEREHSDDADQSDRERTLHPVFCSRGRGPLSFPPPASFLSHASPWSFLFCHLSFFLGFRAISSCSCHCVGRWAFGNAAVSPKAKRKPQEPWAASASLT